MRPDQGVSGCEVTCLPQKFSRPKSRSWWSVRRLSCVALDCQGGDSGQITAGGWGEGEVEYLRGSCSLYKNRKLVLKVQVLFVYLSGSCSLFKNRKLVLKFQVLFVFKFSALRKAGKTTRGMGLAGRARRVKAGCCDLTASMPLRSFGEAFYHRCSFARKMRRCQCRWCSLTFPHLSVGPLLFRQLW